MRVITCCWPMKALKIWKGGEWGGREEEEEEDGAYVSVSLLSLSRKTFVWVLREEQHAKLLSHEEEEKDDGDDVNCLASYEACWKPVVLPFVALSTATPNILRLASHMTWPGLSQGSWLGIASDSSWGHLGRNGLPNGLEGLVSCCFETNMSLGFKKKSNLRQTVHSISPDRSPVFHKRKKGTHHLQYLP